MDAPELGPPVDKPAAARIGWQVLGSRRPFESPVNRLRSDRIEVPGRGEIQYSYLERGESVIIVPVTADGRMVLIRQYRYPVDELCVELPAGCCRDTTGLSLEAVARKELHEEVGATAETLEYVTWFYSSSSISDEVCHIFLARGVALAHAAETEPGEHLEPLVVSVAEALAMARGGRMKTGTCALAVLLCESRLLSQRSN